MAKAKKTLVTNKDTVTVNWQQHMVTAMNAMSSRMYRLSQMMDPRRDINADCGYPQTSGITPQLYWEMYDRNPIAGRVVEVMPKECWAVEPDVYEDEDLEVETPFELAWKELPNTLMDQTWTNSEEGSPIWDTLLRLDILSGIGSYGVMLLGVDDGLDLSLPLQPRKGMKLLYLRPFDERLAEIAAYDPDQSSRRYGQPITYTLTFADPEESHPGQGLNATTKQVHWTRVIHVADNLTSGEVFGVQRQRPVWNNLLDLRKLYGGSAEMYWRGAFPGISFETNPQLGADVEIDDESIKDQMEQYMNSLQRYFYTAGMQAKQLAPQVVDPAGQIEVQIDAICIKLEIPKRVFMGSERGELASSQDTKSWDRRVQRRQKRHVTPRIVAPFVNRLIWARILPTPAQPICVEWPGLEEVDPTQQADIGLKRTQAMAAYVAGGVDILIEPQNYLTKVIGFTGDEAEEIGDATVGHVDEGGMNEPVDERGEEAADLDLEAKRKSVAMIGKETNDAQRPTE